MSAKRDPVHAEPNVTEQDQIMREHAGSILRKWEEHQPVAPFEDVWDRYLSAAEASRRKQQIRNRWRAAAATFLVLILLGGAVLFSSPEVRAALSRFPFMKMMLADGGFEEQGLSKIEKEGLGVHLNTSVIDRNIRFTMDEVFYDGVQIVLNYDVEYLDKKKIIGEKDVAVHYDLKFDGAEPTASSTHKFTQLNDHAFIGSTLIDAYQYLDGYKLHMNITQIGQVKGDWSVTVPLSVSKTSPDTKIFFPNQTVETNGRTRTIERITFTPVSTQIAIRTSEYREHEISYRLRDDLQTDFATSGGLGGDYEIIGNFSPPSAINPHPKYVEVLFDDPSEKAENFIRREEQAPLNDAFPVVLKGRNGGKVTVTRVDYKDEGTILTYEASDAENQRPTLILTDSNEKEHHSIGQPVRISKERFDFQMKFPKLESGSLKQINMTMYDYKPGYEPKPPTTIRVPLDWSKP